jgi:Na+/H+ antiporter NhaD/arsenite permease-like protein
MGMYNLASYPPDSILWQMIAYAAGTGGSILLIGSAAGVALMGLEKVDFIWYMKKISITALTGYLAGMALYLILNAIYF